MVEKVWIQGEGGFMLITAIMLLFVATVLGLMVGGSSQTEMVLSGAQQRYEDDFNTTEGGIMAEARAVSTGVTISRNGTSRTYTVSNPAKHLVILSPTDPAGDALFDPGGDMETADLDPVTMETAPENWPMENLLHSDAAADNRYDYHYRVVYSHADVPPKGYDASSYTGYVFDFGAKRNAHINISGKKAGPKMNL